MCVIIYVYIYIYIYVYIYIYIYVCIYLYIYMCRYVFIYVYIYVCIYIFIYLGLTRAPDPCSLHTHSQEGMAVLHLYMCIFGGTPLIYVYLHRSTSPRTLLTPPHPTPTRRRAWRYFVRTTQPSSTRGRTRGAPRSSRTWPRSLRLVCILDSRAGRGV